MKIYLNKNIVKLMSVFLLLVTVLPGVGYAAEIINSVEVRSVSGGQKASSGNAFLQQVIQTNDATSVITIKSTVNGITKVDISTTTDAATIKWKEGKMAGAIEIKAGNVTDEIIYSEEIIKQRNKLIQELLTSLNIILLAYANKIK